MLSKLNKVDASLLIFFITGLGYTITYFFEWGFLNYYGLPASLIDISITNIIKNIFIISIFVGAGYIQDYYSKKIGEIGYIQKLKERLLKRRNKKKTLLPFFIIMIATLAFLSMNHSPLSWFLLWFIFGVTYLLAEFNHIGPLGLSFVLFTLCCAFIFGQGNAVFTTNYLVLEPSKTDKSDHSTTIIDYYKDKAILAEVDLKDKIIYPHYEFVKLETEPGKMKFKMQRTGFLKVNKP